METKVRRLWTHPFVLLPLIVLALLASVPLIGVGSILLHWAAKERSPAEDITRRLQNDLHMALPAGSTVVHSHRVPMGMDSAGAYELSVPPGAVAEFIKQIRAAAKEQGYQVQENASDPAIFMSNSPARPAWWTPQVAGITKWLELRLPESHAYTIGISPATGQCFIYWMTF